MSSTTTPEVDLVDPNGDLILKVGEVLAAANSDQDQNEETENNDLTYKLIRVSSKVMTLVSPVFDTMLNGNFRESQLQISSEEPPVLELPEDDAAAMLLLCQVLHHHTNAGLHTEMSVIAAMSTVSDKYGCASALHNWYRAQMLRRGGLSLPSTGARDLGLLIQASYNFGDREFFYKSTKLAIQSISQKTLISELGAAMDHTVPLYLVNVLKGTQQSQLILVSRLCQSILGTLVIRDADTKPVRSWNGGYTRLPEVCTAVAKKSASFIAALRTLGLWELDSYVTRHVSLSNVLARMKKVAGEIDVAEKCSRSIPCGSCKEWLGAINVKVKTFPLQTYGMCLECMSSMEGHEVETIASTKCSRHVVLG